MVRFKGTPPYIEFVEYGEKPYADQATADPRWSWDDYVRGILHEDALRMAAEDHATRARLECERTTRPVRPEDV